MVAERSVILRRFMATWIRYIRSENVDMSNDKQCEKHCRFKFKVFKKKIIFLSIYQINYTVPKKKMKIFFWWVIFYLKWRNINIINIWR